MAERKVTYADTIDDLEFLVSLGVPLSDIAERMGRSTQAVYAMLHPGGTAPHPTQPQQNKHKGR